MARGDASPRPVGVVRPWTRGIDPCVAKPRDSEKGFLYGYTLRSQGLYNPESNPSVFLDEIETSPTRSGGGVLSRY